MVKLNFSRDLQGETNNELNYRQNINTQTQNAIQMTTTAIIEKTIPINTQKIPQKVDSNSFILEYNFTPIVPVDNGVIINTPNFNNVLIF